MFVPTRALFANNEILSAVSTEFERKEYLQRCKFAKFQNLTTSFWLLFSLFYRSANVPFYLFPRKSVNHVRNQPKQPTHLFIVCRRGLGLGQVFPNFLRPCTPSAFRYMSINLKFLVTKRLGKTTKIYLPISIH